MGPLASDSNIETERRIRANNPSFNAQFRYAKNFIKTSKYTVINFVPYNLFEQFQRLANFYFLVLLVLQLIPVISSLTPITTAVPLIGVLMVTAIKDAYDDYQRHRSDSQVNKRKSKVLRDGELREEIWSKVVVGDVIRMENDQFVAADILLLSSSEPNGLCYIETSELDGESNLKCKQCLPETAELGQDAAMIGAFDGEIVCEAPNNQLNKFEGTLFWEGEKYPLDNDKLLLRGCILRNTSWCYGVVVFAGRDTKLMQNSGKTKFKRTSIDRLLNFIILGIVFFLLSMCLFCTVACGIWETMIGQNFRVYLPWDSLVPTDSVGGSTVIALLVFFSYAIVLNTVVPISLYVSVEVIRFGQSFLINWDDRMAYETPDPRDPNKTKRTFAKARTTTLNEELGQVEYIFSDKTGTLTRNIMAFNKCSINGQTYGEILDPRTGEPVEITEGMRSVDLSQNPYYEPSFKFYDSALTDALKSRDKNCQEFFRLLALCHTVMPEVKNGKLEYQAQSPDEGALVSAARNFGFVFLSRTPNSITISANGNEETYELLCILDFNNVRKRMSVILRRDGKIRLYCKGADSIIYERLRKGQDALNFHTQEHLNKFAGEGLRTLCLAVKDLEEPYFQDWKRRHHEAATAMTNRDEKLHEIYEEVEKNLTLIGATAIEDKLQDGVPQTIASLALADIKLWVLTGDKQETAINIGYSCQLLTDDLVDVLIVDGQAASEVESQLRNYLEDIRAVSSAASVSHADNHTSVSVVSFRYPPNSLNAKRANPNDDGSAAGNTMGLDTLSEDGETTSGFALVINGHSLVWALNPKFEKLFLDVATRYNLDLVKRHMKAVTLAIGDGANDVSMIKTAHIGVGISGQEGMQAVLSSDYSMAQFRYLERLLLVHGRWSYYRMCKFLRYFFYKNFAFTLCHFWFAFFVGFSAQTVFDPMFIAVYNLFYTSMPVLALGIFDQDVDARNSMAYPKLYTPGVHNTLFNKPQFLRSAFHGFVASGVLFFIPYGAYYTAVDQHGRGMADHQLFGTVVASILVLVVTVQICLDTSYWTVFNHVTIWGSPVMYLIAQFFYNYALGGDYVGTLVKTLEEPLFYFTCMLTLVVLMVPVVAWRFYWVDVHPTLADKVRYKQRLEAKLASKRSHRTMRRTPSARRSRRSVRSGYAFAHQEGYGRLITSGKIMRPNPLQVQPRPARNQLQTGPSNQKTSSSAPNQTTTGHMTNLPGYASDDLSVPNATAAAAAAGLVSNSINQVVNGSSSGGRKRKKQEPSIGLTTVHPQPPSTVDV
ncbi:phospholipid-transporting ATPase ID-like [Hyalella azteca]|uniref:Phospholipid-transporting ATPase n=1 Tax=Hyalella azteca TaxID=294128 RepID=A0A979FVA1_HYAAZ|nr:phospholipid-transporting ATPase ID-like [Hyalella azteca]